MTHHVLLIGGHGKVAQLMTPLLLQKSWTVTSMIRTRSQEVEIKKLGEGQPGNLNVLAQSLTDVKTVEKAKEILDWVEPDYVVWAAGAGGSGGDEMTLAIDRDAAANFVNASNDARGIKKFLLISYLASRRKPAPWWGEEDTKYFHAGNEQLATYYKAKLFVDELLYRTAPRKRTDFRGICLRPGTLTDEPAGGVSLGETKTGNASREAVAQTAVELLASDKPSVWVDMVDGDKNVSEAVRDLNRDSARGESIHVVNE